MSTLGICADTIALGVAEDAESTVIARSTVQALAANLDEEAVEAACKEYANGDPDEYPSPSGIRDAIAAYLNTVAGVE